ncbi:MAG: methyltransferase domain-containing protein [Pirellulaceae bacterium]|nr:methyltransferase domain-containing protein [Pirellulaceae bacterium]
MNKPAADASVTNGVTVASGQPAPENQPEEVLRGEMVRHRCRFCDAPLDQTFVDLGVSPLCESFVAPDQLHLPETFYPLHVYVCRQCWLVQLPAHVSPETIFREYAYFSSYSDSWLDHARRYAERMTGQLNLTACSQVVEVASNDGYLLRNFVSRGIPALGIEPAANVARVARQRGVPTRVAFFGRELARELADGGARADLLIGNNVLAHVPDLNDFVAGIQILLAPGGLLTMEFPHLQRMIERNQFDTIYHEHYSYFSLHAAARVFSWHGLQVVDAEPLETHGGSLRVYVRHGESADGATTDRLRQLLDQEQAAGLDRAATYSAFARRVAGVKCRLLEFLIEARQRGRRVVGYGAPGKGNTLLNYCGIGPELLEFTVDRNPCKQGKFLPGTRIPVFAPRRIDEVRPDYVLILPWNLRDEIEAQLAHVRQWGGKFVIPIPRLHVE